MRRSCNQYGFSAIEVAIFVIAMGFAGAGSYVAYNKIQNNNPNPPADTAAAAQPEQPAALHAGSDDPETASWTEVVSGQGGFAMRIPDGWSLTNFLEDNDVRAQGQAQDTLYVPGAKTTIENFQGSYNGDGYFRFDIIQFKNSDKFSMLDGDETAEPFTAGTLNGVRYHKQYPVAEQDGIGPYPGTDAYTYEFKTDKTTTYVSYNIFNSNKYTKDYVAVSDKNQLDIVDKAVKTLRIKE